MTAIESISKQVESFRLLAVPVGTVVPFAGPVSESEVDKPEDKLTVRSTTQYLEKNGWLVCDGRPLRRDAYPELYDKIREAHGGGFDSESNRIGDFNLPDYRGMFLRGVDHGKKKDPDTQMRTPAVNGGNSHDRVGSIQTYATALPHDPFVFSGGGHTHTHYLRKATSEHRGINKEGKHWKGSIYTHAWDVPVKGSGEHSHQLSGGDKETRAVNAYVNFLIRAR
jgi:microcystin-dependent protein